MKASATHEGHDRLKDMKKATPIKEHEDIDSENINSVNLLPNLQDEVRELAEKLPFLEGEVDELDEDNGDGDGDEDGNDDDDDLVRQALENEDMYAVLGVKFDASTQEVQQAYRRLMFEYHPDRNPDPIEAQKFHLITTAGTV